MWTLHEKSDNYVYTKVLIKPTYNESVVSENMTPARKTKRGESLFSSIPITIRE